MKAAFIPPIKELDRFGRGDFHLLLSHLLSKKDYRRHYMAQRAKGAYLCLDNSAHEFRAAESASILLQQAVDLQVQEIVVPDVLEDADGTIEAAIDAIEVWFEQGTYGSIKALNPSLMYVPQGSAFQDWKRCIQELVRLHLYSSIKFKIRRNFVIGLSKDYERWEGGLIRLLDEVLLPLRNQFHQGGIRVQVHMLGWGRQLWKLEDISRAHRWIRSTDSAKPFVYALKGIVLDPTQDPPKYPRRPRNYFSTELTQHQRRIAVSNCMLFKAMAHGNRDHTVIV